MISTQVSLNQYVATMLARAASMGTAGGSCCGFLGVSTRSLRARPSGTEAFHRVTDVCGGLLDRLALSDAAKRLRLPTRHTPPRHRRHGHATSSIVYGNSNRGFPRRKAHRLTDTPLRPELVASTHDESTRRGGVLRIGLPHRDEPKCLLIGATRSGRTSQAAPPRLPLPLPCAPGSGARQACARAPSRRPPARCGLTRAREPSASSHRSRPAECPRALSQQSEGGRNGLRRAPPEIRRRAARDPEAP